MTSYRSRSKSPQRRRSDSPEHKGANKLPQNAEEISESDYFMKNDEFRAWLKEEKDRYFDELSGEKARSYFRKFVKAWNRGKLDKSYYSDNKSAPHRASSQTAYKWSFAKKRSQAEQDALEDARLSVSAATRAAEPESAPGASSSSGSRKGKLQGPTLPSRDDIVLAREEAEEYRAAEKNFKRKRERAEDKSRIEDMVGPKEQGREGMLEKKRVKRENDRSFRDAKDDPLGEFDESTLMGGGDSFQAHLARREAAKKRHQAAREEKDVAVKERQSFMKERDKATMDMFQKLAKERFG